MALNRNQQSLFAVSCNVEYKKGRLCLAISPTYDCQNPFMLVCMAFNMFKSPRDSGYSHVSESSPIQASSQYTLLPLHRSHIRSFITCFFPWAIVASFAMTHAYQYMHRDPQSAIFQQVLYCMALPTSVQRPPAYHLLQRLRKKCWNTKPTYSPVASMVASVLTKDHHRRR